MGHEFPGVVADIGSEVGTVEPGDLVVVPFAYSDNTCEYCRRGPQTSVLMVGSGVGASDGGQVRQPVPRMPMAFLVKMPVDEDSDLLPDLLTLSDVLCTGYHAARTAGVAPGDTVAVIGDGAVGLSAVISAKLLGAEQIS